jgi:hypothetical protein
MVSNITTTTVKRTKCQPAFKNKERRLKMKILIELEVDVDTVEGRVPTEEEVKETITDFINNYFNENPINLLYNS